MKANSFGGVPTVKGSKRARILFLRCASPNDQIATALRLYYEGLSLDAIKEEFEHQFNKNVATSTLYEWIQDAQLKP